MSRHASTARRSFLVFALLTVVSACALPDVKPFTDATVQLQSAIATSGRTAANEVSALGRTPADQATCQDLAGKLETAWAQRVLLMGALVEYAQSLQAIAESGSQGRAAVNELSDAVRELGVSSTLLPAGDGGAADDVKDLVAQVYAQITTILAARALEDALDAAQPAIQIIANHLSQDLDDLDEILQDAMQELRDSEETALADELALRRVLEVRRKQLSGRAAEAMGPAEVAELTEVDALLATTDRWYQPLEHRLTEIDERLAASRHLIATCQSGIEQWAMAHTTLARAVRRRDVANVSALVQAGQEIRDQIRKVREQ